MSLLRPLTFLLPLALTTLLLLSVSFCVIILSPLLPLRQRNNAAAKLYRIATTYVLGIRIQVEGTLEGEEGARVIVANHQSMMDISCIAGIWQPGMVILAKEEMRYYPILGTFMRWAGNIFISRGDSARAIQTLNDAAEILRTRIGCQHLLIFPEGTRSSGLSEELLPFKKGGFHLAKQAGAKIIPVVFSDYGNVYSWHKRIFTPGVIHAKILPSIETEGRDVASLMTETRDAMSVALKELNAKHTKTE